jgi:hypothetical protein
MAAQDFVRQGLVHFTKIEGLWERHPDLRNLSALAAIATAVAAATPITQRVAESDPAFPVSALGARVFQRSSEELHGMLEEITANPQVDMLQAYEETVYRKGKSYPLEALMQDCLEFLQEVAPESDKVALKAAEKALRESKSPVQDTSTKTWNYNTSSGTQVVMSGRGNQHVNTGTAAQYNGVVNQHGRAGRH